MAQSDELVNKYCCIANSSKRKMLSSLTEDRSMTSIARENNTSVNTVQRVLGTCSHRFMDDYDSLPEHLAFDEFKGLTGPCTLSVSTAKLTRVFRYLETVTRRICSNILASSLQRQEAALKRLPWS